MQYKVSIGSRYTVTANTANCVVTDAAGRIVATVKPGEQYTFTASTATVELSDASAALTANFNSAPAAGGAGGVTEESLVELGLLDEWTESTVVDFAILGSLVGVGSSKPMSFPASGGVSVGYILSGPFELNRLTIRVKSNRVPVVQLNGVRCTEVEVNPLGEWVEVTYALPLMSVEFFGMWIEGADELAGGASLGNATAWAGSPTDLVYPYVFLRNVKEEKKLGIEAEVYVVRAIRDEMPALYVSTVDVEGVCSYFRTAGGFLTFDFGSVGVGASSSADGCVGFTAVIYRNRQELRNVLSDVVSFYKSTSADGSKLKIFRIR